MSPNQKQRQCIAEVWVKLMGMSYFRYYSESHSNLALEYTAMKLFR